MNPRSILMALLWAAALGLVVLFGTRIAGKVGAKASGALPV